MAAAGTLTQLGCVDPVVHWADSGDDSAEDTGPGTNLAPPEWFDYARYYTVPPDRGLVWERDPDFVLEGFSVPAIVVEPDGSYTLLATNMFDPVGRWRLTSPDAENWTADDEALLTGEDFSVDCGNRLPDAAILYRPDSYHIVMEGAQLENTGITSWRGFCHASSPVTTPLNYTTLPDYFLEMPEDENGEHQPSVPTFLPTYDDDALLYFVDAVDSPEYHGGIRLAHVTTASMSVEVLVTDNLLDDADVDPDPIYLEGGGIRLYHTHGIGGGPGYTDTFDGTTMGEDTELIVPNGSCNESTEGGECILDPYFLHLPDDRLVMYFTVAKIDDRGDIVPQIQRAWAQD